MDRGIRDLYNGNTYYMTGISTSSSAIPSSSSSLSNPSASYSSYLNITTGHCNMLLQQVTATHHSNMPLQHVTTNYFVCPVRWQLRSIHSHTPCKSYNLFDRWDMSHKIKIIFQSLIFKLQIKPSNFKVTQVHKHMLLDVYTIWFMN